MLLNTKSFKQVVQELITNTINEQNNIDIFEITGPGERELSYNIKRLNTNESFLNIDSIGIGKGNGKGLLKKYDVGDLVICCFIQNSRKPYIMGSIFDTISTTKDSRIEIKNNEFYVNNKINGAFIYMNENNTIKLRTPNGAKIQLNNDGSFKLFDKNNYGFESDGSGNITIRGTTINHTQTPGSWE